MENGFDAVPRDEVADERSVRYLTLHEDGAVRDMAARSGREIVEDHDILAAVDQCEYRVATDIAGAAGHQNAHEFATDFSGTLP
ncbi:MAG: hypothetical protein WDM81_19130 [Rhizomicrobium sp.]